MTTGIRHLLAAGTTLALCAGAAHAQTTPAGTTVSNQATATFTVNGTPATARSNVSTFTVDRKVDLTLVAQTGTTRVNLGDTGAVLSFVLTNKTNGTQDFLLDPDQQNISFPGLLGTDDFDVTGLRAFADRNGNNTYDPGVDDQPFVDELPADRSVTVFLVGDVPTRDGLSFANASMHVTVAAGGAAGTRGGMLVPTDLLLLGRDDQEDIVFADGDSDGASPGDVARNGQARAYAAFEIGARTVDLSITKTSRVVEDGLGTLTPRALPGAVVEYCLLVRNATPGVPATGVVLADPLPAQVSFVTGSIRVGGTCLLCGEAQDDDADDANDGRVFAGGYDAAARTVAATIPIVPGGGAVAAVFRVRID